jgi:hypothetical protein
MVQAGDADEREQGDTEEQEEETEEEEEEEEDKPRWTLNRESPSR